MVIPLHITAPVSQEAPPLEELFKENYARLVHYAYQYLNDKQSAEDVVQEAFIKYWDLKDNISAEVNAIKSFLYTSVRNASLNMLRHTKVTDAHAATAAPVATEEETIIHAIIKAEVLGELHQAIASLPESCQQVSRLGYLEGMKNQEIAEELGISINTVKTQKKRGLKLLRARLNPEIISLLLLFLSQK